MRFVSGLLSHPSIGVIEACRSHSVVSAARYQRETLSQLSGPQLSVSLCCSLSLCLSIFLGFGIPRTVVADQRMNMEKAETTNFSAGFAAPLPKEIWDKSISEPSGKFILLRSWDDEKKDLEEEAVAIRGEEKPLTPAEESEPEGKEVAMVDESRESIIERYGDPKERVVITPDQAAPKPFKGIHAALQIGDEQLAFDYARKHVRYMSQFEDRVGNLQGLIAKAMEAEGIADGEGWTADPQFARYEKYVQKAQEEKQKEAEPVWDEFILALPEQHRLRAMLPMSQATQYDVVRELEHREEFRRYFQKKAPQTPDGKVVVTLYVNTKNDKDSLLLARELSRIGQHSLKDDGLAFHIRSLHYASNHELKNFKRRSGLFGVEASVLDPDGKAPNGPYPLLTIELPALKKEYRIHGIRRSYFFEELLSVMSGRGLS